MACGGVPSSFCFQPKSAQPRPTDSLRVSHKSEEVVLQLPLHVPLRSLWTAIVKSVRVGKSLGVGEREGEVKRHNTSLPPSPFFNDPSVPCLRAGKSLPPAFYTTVQLYPSHSWEVMADKMWLRRFAKSVN